MSDEATSQPDSAAHESTTAPKHEHSEAPNWLPMRLEQAKRSATNETLKAIGVDTIDTAKALIEKAKHLEQQSKSEIEKLAERIVGLEPRAKRADVLQERLEKLADIELAKLSDAQRSAVLTLAGDDKTAALNAIEALRPTWTVSKSDAVSPTQVPLPPPAKTSASVAAPVAATNPAVDHKATYEALKRDNPLMAARYLVIHQRDIYSGS